MNASQILQIAAELVSGPRDREHGDKLRNHRNIADLWSAYLGVRITAMDVALMQVLLKVARTKTGSLNLDDFVDICGYGGCAGEIASRTHTAENPNGPPPPA